MSDSDDDKPLGQRTAVSASAPAAGSAPSAQPTAPTNKPAAAPAKPVLQPKPVKPAAADDSDDDLPLAKRQAVAGALEGSQRLLPFPWPGTH